MIDEERGDGFLESIVEREVKRRRRKRVLKWLAGGGASSIFTVLLPTVVILLIVSGLGSGISMVSSFFNGMFGEESEITRFDEKSNAVSRITEEQILEMIKNNKFDDSFYKTIMMNKEEFVYLLEEVMEYNSQEVTRTIEIECLHKYRIWVPDPALPSGPVNPANPSAPDESDELVVPSGHYQDIEEKVYKDITVTSKDIETFRLDWQLVYAVCLANMPSNSENWVAGEGDTVHFGERHEVLDEIIDSLKMEYTYITDLARDSKRTYSMDECEAMAHTTFQYGDASTEEGEWTYYYPHSLLASAQSGYSKMYYEIEDNMINGIVEASDMQTFENLFERIGKHYSPTSFNLLLKFVPGGDRLSEKFSIYIQNAEESCRIDGRALNYEIGFGINSSSIPTGDSLNIEFGGNVDYGDLVFDESIGGKIVAESMKYLGWTYSQTKRWQTGYADCSSLVWQVIQDAGIDPNSIFAGSTAAEECRGMWEAGMMIPIENIQQGDIIFYSYEKNGRFMNVDHVAIYAGDGKIVHASYGKQKVIVANFYGNSVVCVCRPYVAR